MKLKTCIKWRCPAWSDKYNLCCAELGVKRQRIRDDNEEVYCKLPDTFKLIKKPKLMTMDRVNRIINKLYYELGAIDDDSLHVMVVELEEYLDINKDDDVKVTI